MGFVKGFTGCLCEQLAPTAPQALSCTPKQTLWAFLRWRSLGQPLDRCLAPRTGPSWYCSSTSEALTRVVATKVFVGSPRFCGLVNSETSMSYSYLVRVAMLKQFVWLYSICVGYVRCIAVPRVFFSEQTCITS